MTHQSLAHVALVVRDYDEAIDFYVGTLGFTLVADDYQPAQDKRWVLVAPPGAPEGGATILLARSSATSRADASSCSCEPTISLATIKICWPRAYGSSASRWKRITVPSRCSSTSMATSGT
jgi:hypothetical protein